MGTIKAWQKMPLVLLFARNIPARLMPRCSCVATRNKSIFVCTTLFIFLDDDCSAVRNSLHLNPLHYDLFGAGCLEILAKSLTKKFYHTVVLPGWNLYFWMRWLWKASSWGTTGIRRNVSIRRNVNVKCHCLHLWLICPQKARSQDPRNAISHFVCLDYFRSFTQTSYVLLAPSFSYSQTDRTLIGDWCHFNWLWLTYKSV